MVDDCIKCVFKVGMKVWHLWVKKDQIKSSQTMIKNCLYCYSHFGAIWCLIRTMPLYNLCRVRHWVKRNCVREERQRTYISFIMNIAFTMTIWVNMHEDMQRVNFPYHLEHSEYSKNWSLQIFTNCYYCYSRWI